MANVTACEEGPLDASMFFVCLFVCSCSMIVWIWARLSRSVCTSRRETEQMSMAWHNGRESWHNMPVPVTDHH